MTSNDITKVVHCGLFSQRVENQLLHKPLVSFCYLQTCHIFSNIDRILILIEEVFSMLQDSIKSVPIINIATILHEIACRHLAFVYYVISLLYTAMSTPPIPINCNVNNLQQMQYQYQFEYEKQLK